MKLFLIIQILFISNFCKSFFKVIFRIEKASEGLKFDIPWFCFCSKNFIAKEKSSQLMITNSSNNNVFNSSEIEIFKKSVSENVQLIAKLNMEIKILKSEIEILKKENELNKASTDVELKKIKEEKELLQSYWRNTFSSLEDQHCKQNVIMEKLQIQNNELNKTIIELKTKLKQNSFQSLIKNAVENNIEKINEQV